jgi:uncharacterized protein YbcI
LGPERSRLIVALMREHYGRGPIKAKTYVLDSLIVCVLSKSWSTPVTRARRRARLSAQEHRD